MRRPSPWLLLLFVAALAFGWLAYDEIEGAGLLGRSSTSEDRRPPSRAAADAELGEDLARRAELRGLPGIQTRRGGFGWLTGAVHLHVPGQGKRPLPDVTVHALGLDEGRTIPREAKTDEEGRFNIPAVAAMVGYAIVVRHPPYRDVVLRGIDVRRDRGTDVGTILLGAPTVLRGEVVDAAGRRVSGAEVQVLKDRSRPSRWDLRQGLRELQAVADPLAEGISTLDGSFRLLDLPPGRYVVRVSSPGYATAFRSGVWITLDERASALRVVLDVGAGYTGRVTDAEERGIADARVIAVAIGGKSTGGLDRVETRSGSDGHYRLDSLIPGVRYFIEAWAEGFAPAGRIVQSEAMSELDFTLGASGRVAGRVTDETTGEGIPGAEVMLVAGLATSLSPLSMLTDDEGRYAFEAVGAGPVMLFAAKADGHPASSFTLGGEKGYAVKVGETTVIDAALPAGVVVEGRVLDRRGTPVPFATLAFGDRRRRAEGEETALTGIDGTYRVEGLREATYDVRITAPGYAPLTDEKQARLEVKAPSGVMQKDFELEHGASLEGLVRDPQGAPVSGARVEVQGRGGRRARERVQDCIAVTSPTGAWRITGVPPNAEIQVEARHDAWARALSAPMRLAPGQEQKLDLTLGEGARIEGRVVDAKTGGPVAEARVRWGPVGAEGDRATRDAFRADQLLGARVVRTDRNGHFVVDRLEPGRFLLKVEQAGYADWYRKDVLVPPDEAPPPLKVELEAEGRIRGRVTAAGTNTPIAGAWIYAREEDPQGEETAADPGLVRALVSTQTDEDGRYVLEGVPPGEARRYEVVVWLALGFRAAVQDRNEASVRRKGLPCEASGIDFTLEPDRPDAAN